MAKGTRQFRATRLVRSYDDGRVRFDTSAHARLELAMKAVRVFGEVGRVVWHLDASPFRDEQIGKVR